jgi:hypothetical protein
LEYDLTLCKLQNFSYNSIANFYIAKVVSLCLNSMQSANHWNSAIYSDLHIHTVPFNRFQHPVHTCSLFKLSAICLLTCLFQSHKLQLTFNFICIWNKSDINFVTNTVLRINWFNFMVVNTLDQADTEFWVMGNYHIVIFS